LLDSLLQEIFHAVIHIKPEYDALRY